MTALKWTWKIIWRCIFVPVIVTIVVMIATMFFIDDTNQASEGGKAYQENYGTSYHQYSNQASESPTMANKFNKYNSRGTRNYVPKRVQMQEDDFDTTAIVTMIALFVSFIFMVIYTIMDFRDYRKKQADQQLDFKP